VITLDLAGRAAVVSGGARGLGAAIARTLAAAGARVTRLDVAEPEDAGADWLRCDVADAAEVRRAVDEVAQRHGRLDLVVAAAGITRDGVLWKLSPEDWRAVLAVNLDGAFHLLHAAVPHLRAAGGGAIVLISSINGERGKFGQSSYAASKAGLIGLGKTAAKELGRFGVRVNVLAPGLIDTAMTAALSAEIRAAAVGETALGRMGKPQDVADAALFLCSDLARHVTGQVLRVDGGQLM
jgi:acetoacetyl-CoA reductase/3-oxoacyl-[acyl-carrier protein] reductase